MEDVLNLGYRSDLFQLCCIPPTYHERVSVVISVVSQVTKTGEVQFYAFKMQSFPRHFGAKHSNRLDKKVI